ncbi:MAG TPA: GatB/YqeY domain-containing protein [Bacteroidales bacterium]|nr:GatB/YqeY domain-containing protein [Bacteroidales bacterium]
MSLVEKIENDLKAAMKAREKERLETLRSVKSAFMIARTEKGASHEVLTDDAVLKILQKLAKQRRESAEIYKSQNRGDLADKEMSEAAVIEEYLPKPLTDEELDAALKSIIAETGASSMADMGKVMGVATRQLAGRADGKTISARVKQLLSV